MDHEAGDEARGETHAPIQGVQVGNGNNQYNTFKITLDPPTAPGPISVGNVPKEPQAFQKREDLLAALAGAGSDVPIVRVMIGMPGVGKTQVAAVYARRRVPQNVRTWSGDQRRESKAEIDKALTLLADASLLTYSGDDSSIVTAHRLVTRVCYERMVHDKTLLVLGERTWAVLADSAMALGPEPERSAARDFVRQATALHERLVPHLGSRDMALTANLLIMRSVALYHLVGLGDSTLQAIAIGEPLLAECEQVLGEDHQSTLRTRGRLADAYQKAGRYEDATSLLKQALAGEVRTRGEDHPGTLMTRNNLAHMYTQVGLVDEAILLFEQTLAGREQALGKNHRDTWTTLCDLAIAYTVAGRREEAIRLCKRMLADGAPVVPREVYPTALVVRDALAFAYVIAGRLDEALSVFQQTLADCVGELGEDHPSTLMALYTLAGAYKKVGRLDEAIRLYEQAFAGSKRAWGEDHSRTEPYRRSLAAARRVAETLGAADEESS